MNSTDQWKAGLWLVIVPRQFSSGIAIATLFLSTLATLPIAAQTGGNTALIVSGPWNDPITNGGSYYYLPANATFTLSQFGDHELRIEVKGADDVQDQWGLDFASPDGTTLEVAEYDNCQRFPSDTAGGLDVNGFLVGCNQDLGSFIVHELVRSLDGQIDSFHISFQQSCDGTYPPLAGEIFYNSSHMLPPAPIPAPTAKPGQLSVISVSVSPKQIVEGSDAFFTFTCKPAPVRPLTVGINEIDIGGRQVSFPVGGAIRFGAGVSSLTVPLHTHADAIAQKKTKYMVQITRAPIYKIGTKSASVNIIDPPH